MNRSSADTSADGCGPDGRAGGGQSSGGGESGGYLHDALLYESTESMLAVAVPFLRDGLAAGDGAVIATGPETAAALHEALDGDPRVRRMDRSAAYRRRAPAAVAAFRGLVDRPAGQPGRVRVVGEVDFGTTEQQRLEWQRYEAVINQALAPWPLWGLCLFDTRRLPEPVIDAALRTHPVLTSAGGRQANARYTEPAAYLRSLPVPREPVEETAPRLRADGITDFIGLRHAVAAELAAVRAPRDLVEDFLLAVDEMTSNAVRHGRPPVSLRLWTSADKLVCTIHDRGAGPDDPFAGYGPAHGEDLSRGGMGLWLARQLCDHVDIRSGETGVTVRLVTRLR